MWRAPGEDVAVVPGTSDFAVGTNRVSFLVVDKQSRLVERPTARVWISRGLKQAPFAQTTARLESIGVPGGATADADGIYVATMKAPTPGTYWFLAEPVGGRKIQALGQIVVRKQSAAPAVGDRAISSNTPTLASTGGDLSALTTSRKPDRALYQTSVAQALAAHEPFVAQLRDPAVLPVPDVRPGGGHGLRRQEAPELLRRPLHPRRDLQGQRPGEGRQPVGEAVAAPDRAVHVRRRREGCHPDEARGRLLGGRARPCGGQGALLARPRGQHVRGVPRGEPSPH